MTSRRLQATLALLALFLGSSAARAQQAPLTQLQFDIVGVRLTVDPPALTVPKNIATQINTTLVLPPASGDEARAAIEALTTGALVEAELRGPNLAPTRIVTRPGQPIPIPPLATPGDYFLDGIRLVKNGATVLDATTADGRLATTIPIAVISEVFVTNVTSRPLSLDEIRDRGVVIDQNNFRAVSFQVAFNIDGAPFTIDVPAALPTPEFLQQRPTREQIVRQLTAINQQLRGTETRLPPQFDRPGLNFSIAALPFFPVPEDDGGVPDLVIPPITGLVVIPGNVAFLNQFFSVLLTVTNVAPDGTSLELRETSAKIVLPNGLDRVAGTFTQPGDDPLRLARIEGVGIQPVVPVVQAGTDGVLHTADDIPAITPQRSGQGEFLVEGLKEGAHLFDIQIETTLFGLPSGPVRLAGQASGAVFVRNPTFSVSLAHPRTIRSGEPYDLYATVTNTSSSAANLVTVALEPRAISGAQLLSDAAVSFETVAPGQAVTARFRLLAQKTGQVTFSSFTGDASAGGGIQLTTGIDERGVPLAPNAIVLPKATDNLPQGLIAAAQRVLGQAFSIATAPAEALPRGVAFVKRQTVIDRGTELAQAGERIGFGEPIGRVVQDLLLDWLGNHEFDAGFDEILRTTEAGGAFLDEVAAILRADVSAPTALAYQQAMAETLAGRARHLSAIVGAAPGATAPFLTVARIPAGTAGRTSAGAERSLPGAAAFDFVNASGNTRLTVAGRIDADRYRVRIVAPANGVYEFGVVAPGASDGDLRQLRFSGIQLGAGGTASVDIDLTSAAAPLLLVDRDGNGSVDDQVSSQPLAIAEQAPGLVDVRQLASAYRETAGDLEDPATYGLVLGVLFDKPVTQASAQTKTNYTIAGNAVVGARLQPNGRVVYLYLERPVGTLIPRTLTVANIADLHGNVLPSAVRPILAVLSDGARVFGQVRAADGAVVPSSVVKLSVVFETRTFDVSTVRTGADGSFDFDFVPRLGTLVLQAQHPVTQEIASVSARIRGAGGQMLLSPTFRGRGTVRGRVLGADGVSPVANASVALLPGAVLSSRGFETRTNALGEFSFGDIPVGVFTLSAADTAGGFGQTTGVLASGSATAALDVVLTSRLDDGGHAAGRVFQSDGATAAAEFTVYVGHYDRSTGRLEAIDRTSTDATGTFTFARTLPPGGYDVVAVDPATGQIGVGRIGVTPRQTASISIVLEAVGSIEGVVFAASGAPLAGALVAGGTSLVTTNANGFFRMEGVPAGRRTIEAGDPVTRRRGSATVTVLPGQTVSAAIALEARATIVGRVLDATGTPVPRATVRIPQLGGYTFVFANDQGVYTFPDMPLGEYLIQAPGPSRESLISFMEASGYDPRSAFTSGDIPSELGSGPPSSAGGTDAVIGAYQEAVRTFLSVDPSLLGGLPMADMGGFGWTKVQLFQDSTTIASDVRFLAQGTVAGHTRDSAGRSIGALTRITGVGVSLTGFPTLVEIGRVTTDAATGAFSFAHIPRFDLATFQRAGVRGGDFTLEAAHPFSPVIAQFRGQLTTTSPDAPDVILRFPAAAETNGTVRGRVLMPDGSAAPANTRVEIGFGDLTVLTDAQGRFDSPVPIPAGSYVLTATAPNGLRGRTTGLVSGGGILDVTIQLLGLGTTTITVRRPGGQVVSGARISLERGTFPGDRLNGTTDSNGQLHFVNVSEGVFAVSAEEPFTGLSGRASGTIVRDADVPIAVVITASGRVTGTFLSADGATPIPFAQIVLTTGAVRAFTTTDINGRFELLAIPVGRFTIEASEPQTGRVGRGSDELLVEGQTVDITVLQVARGVVRGTVVQADGTTPVPGATVKITGSGLVRTELQASTRPDGSYRFEGISAGELTLTARDSLSGFEGTATAVLTAENEVVERNISLAPFASLDVAVRDAGGAAVSNATVTVLRGEHAQTAAVDAGGHARFGFLSLGEYRVVARSLSNTGDGGEAAVSLTNGAVEVPLTVSFRGTGNVHVTVVGSDGVTPVPSARVTLSATAAQPGGAASALATTLNGFTNGSGTVDFPGVPVGAFFVTAESAALAGVSNSLISAPGTTAAITVRLGSSGTVAGRVLLPDGITPAAQAIVTLRFTPQSALQTGVLQVTTPLTGVFSFSGIPVGAFTVSAFEVVSNGVRNASGAVGTDGQRVDLGDLSLDNAAPRVTATVPADRAVAVSRQPSISITFSEAMRAGSFVTTGSAANVHLNDGAAALELASPAFSSDGRTVTVRPVQPLRSGAAYTLIVRGGQDGPRDQAADLPLLESSISTFATVDDIPPAVVGTSPASGERQVVLDAGIRILASEPIATGTITLRDASGVLVPGVSTITAGNTAVAFSPTQLLHANATYTATLAGVTDTAGNPLAGGTLTWTFRTIDTLAPQIADLQVTGNPRPGATLAIAPVFAAGVAADVRRVDYLLGPSAASAMVAPFGVTTVVPQDTTSLLITAAAVDEFGNRSSAVTRTLTIAANERPQIVLRTTSTVARVSQGQSIEFEAAATDDAALASVALSALGAASFSETRQVNGGQTQFTTRFTIQVPATAASTGTLTVQAAAVDAAGLASTPAVITLPMSDGVRPVVTVLSPVNNAQIVAGQPLTVSVDASDDLGVASLTLTCSPALAGCDTRPISPAVPSTRQSFTITVPDTLEPGTSLVMLVSAADGAGNVTQAGRTAFVPDTVAPHVVAVEPVSGSTRVVAGANASVRASFTDNIGVTAVLFQTEGAVTTSGTVAVAPASASGQSIITFAVPPGAANGSTITVHVQARDAAGSVSTSSSLILIVGDTAAPTVSVGSPAAGTTVVPGQSIAVAVHATDDTAVQRIVLTASGAFSSTETRVLSPAAATADVTFTLLVPPAAAAGELVLSVQAFDIGNNASASAARSITVLDTVAPLVRVVSPANNAPFDPRNPLTVTIEATDAVGVTAIGFTAGGSTTVSENRAVTPAQTSRTETFSVSLTPPAAGGTLTLGATARDQAGNIGLAANVSVQVLDVVAPTVTSIVPGSGATGVDPATSVVITFSEAMRRASLTVSALTISAGGSTVPATLAVSPDDRVVTLTPSSPLAVNTLFTVTVAASVADAAGNPLGTASVSTFRTSSPDVVRPQVASVDPANNSTGVPTTASIAVTFSEPIDPATVSASSFRVLVGSSAVAGQFAFTEGGRIARFTPAAPLPFDAVVITELTSAVTDLAGNALADAAGAALTSPLTFTFLTGNFAITSPGAAVVENTRIALAAQGGSAILVSTVVFTVNGVTLPAAGAPAFSTPFDVPAASATPQLTIVASARNAQNVEVARAEKTVAVVDGIRIDPPLLGIARAASATLRLSTARPVSSDLAITVTAGDPQVVTIGTPNIVLPAGQSSADVSVTACTTCPWDPVAAGQGAGSTAILATSARGAVAATVSVSDRVPGRDINGIAAAAGVSAPTPPSVGQAFLGDGTTSTMSIVILPAPLAGDVPLEVTVISSDPAVATATVSPIQPGQQTATITVHALSSGTAVITLRAGAVVRSFTVVVGAPAPGLTPIVLATPTGLSIPPSPSAGQVLTLAGRTTTLTLQVLSAPLAGNAAAVSVFSSNPAVATATATSVEPGSQVTTLTITTLSDGLAVLTLRVGGEVRSFTVRVGAVPAGETPLVLALPTAVSLAPLPFIGTASAPTGLTFTLGILLLSDPAAAQTSVAVTSSNGSIVSVNGAGTIAAGSRMAFVSLTTGTAGRATLTLEFGTSRREFTLIVGGTLTPGSTPVIVAPPTGVTVVPSPVGSGHLLFGAAAPVAATVGVQLFAAPRAGATSVTVTSSNPAIVALAGGAAVTAQVPAGATVLPVDLVSTGQTGAALLRFEFDGSVHELLVVVGDPPASARPAIVAPVVGVRVNQ